MIPLHDRVESLEKRVAELEYQLNLVLARTAVPVDPREGLRCNLNYEPDCQVAEPGPADQDIPW